MIHNTFSLNTYVSTSIAASAVKKNLSSKTDPKTKAQADLFRLLQSFVAEFVARHGSLMQSLWLDEITLKALDHSGNPSTLTKKWGRNLTNLRFFTGRNAF